MQDLKLAVLIDADNISPKYVKVILDEAASFGVAACKRIYGDWSDARLKSWKDVLLNNSIIPIQQYSYTTGKNATDSAMIIDAMDLLYSGNLDGFCIVSSDSDFTRLAARLREAGVQPWVRVEMESVEGLIDVCRWGELACIVPERAARQAPDMQAIQLHSPQMVRHAGILWRRGASRSRAAVEFAALLRPEHRLPGGPVR